MTGPDAVLRLSPLHHTWILDLDGTLLEHNGYQSGADRFLPGAAEFLRSIPEGDCIVILTAREPAVREQTETFLREQRIRYDYLLCGVPSGERILINDVKPSGLQCAQAVNCPRNGGLQGLQIVVDPKL